MNNEKCLNSSHNNKNLFYNKLLGLLHILGVPHKVIKLDWDGVSSIGLSQPVLLLISDATFSNTF